MLKRTRVGALALAAASTLALLAPTLGHAAVVQVLGDQLRIDGYPGFTNKVVVGYSGATGRFVVDDPVGVTVLGSSCTNLSAERASCDASQVRGISAGLADGDDEIEIASDGAEAVPAHYPARLSGGPGNDVIKGGAADDRLSGDAGRDIVAGGAGDDRLSGGAGSDGLIGFGGDDVLSGGPGRDALFGQKGRDSMLGGPGNDVLLARDHRRDARLNCGPGNSERAVRDRIDPPARGCNPKRPTRG